MFEDLEVANRLVHFSDVDRAFGYLRKEEERSPWLIFLNLGQQDTKSMEFLKTLKSDRKLKLIPVVSLATSRDQATVSRSFDYTAAGYMVRPSEHTEPLKAINAILQYWTLCGSPSNGR